MTEKAMNLSKAPVASYGSGDLGVTVLADSTVSVTVGGSEYSIPSDAAAMLAEAITDCKKEADRQGGPERIKQYFCETHDRVYHCEGCMDDLLAAEKP